MWNTPLSDSSVHHNYKSWQILMMQELGIGIVSSIISNFEINYDWITWHSVVCTTSHRWKGCVTGGFHPNQKNQKKKSKRPGQLDLPSSHNAWPFKFPDMLKTPVGVPVIRTDNLIFLSVLSLVRRTKKLLRIFRIHFHLYNWLTSHKWMQKWIGCEILMLLYR